LQSHLRGKWSRKSKSQKTGTNDQVMIRTRLCSPPSPWNWL
jgi:hypothetical protein